MTTSDPQLMTIGEFARVTGLTASALRFTPIPGCCSRPISTGYRDTGGTSPIRLHERGCCAGSARSPPHSVPPPTDILDAAPAEAAQLVDDSRQTTVRGRDAGPGLRCPHHRRSVDLRTWSGAAAPSTRFSPQPPTIGSNTILNTVRIESDCTTGTLTLWPPTVSDWRFAPGRFGRRGHQLGCNGFGRRPAPRTMTIRRCPTRRSST